VACAPTLRVALQQAVKKRLVPYNVVRDAEPPAQRQREIKTLSREEVATSSKRRRATATRPFS
jgi:hypothetical protein